MVHSQDGKTNSRLLCCLVFGELFRRKLAALDVARVQTVAALAFNRVAQEDFDKHACAPIINEA